MIVKRKDGYHVLSEGGKNLGGPYGTRGEAEKRLHEVEWFKKHKSTASLEVAAKGLDGQFHKYSSTQIQLPGDMARRMVALGKLIDENDVYNDPEDPSYGRETDAHITVQFGLHTADPADVADVIRGFGPVKATLGKVSLFEGDQPYDVLKFEVDSPDLHRLHKLINSKTECTDMHPQYKPHATIAYLKKGAGARYTHGTAWATKAEQALSGQAMEVYTVMFSGKNRIKTPISLHSGLWTSAAGEFDAEWPPIYNELSDALDAVRQQLTAVDKAISQAASILSDLDDYMIDHRDDQDGGAAIARMAQEAISKVEALDPRLEPLVRALKAVLVRHTAHDGDVASAWLAPAATARTSAQNRNVLVGVSGFSYKSWSGQFYPANLPRRQRLAYYAERFPTVEVSATAHQMPEYRVLKGWDEKTPAGFVMAFRGPQEATHERRLLGCGPLMAEFCRRLEVLGDKLGPIGFQLPESARFDPALLRAFCAALPSGFKYAMEFRSEPWYTQETYDILSEHGVALTTVSHSNMGIHPVHTTDWSYFRMSGHNPDWSKNCYSRQDLMNWRGIISESKGRAYVYFNNEYSAFSAKNAATLMALLGLAKESEYSYTTGPGNSQQMYAQDPDNEIDRAKDVMETDDDEADQQSEFGRGKPA